MKVEKNCKTCGEKFFVLNYRKDKALYCSYKCYWGFSKSITPPQRMKCTKCDVVKDIRFFHRSRMGKFGRRTYCSSCGKKMTDLYKESHYDAINERQRQYYRNTVNTPLNKYKKLVHGAKNRGKEINITFEDFMGIYGMPCFYCGDEVLTSGIDRVNSSKGYVLGNIVRCCQICNRAKNNLSVKDFLSHCRKIVENNLNNI